VIKISKANKVLGKNIYLRNVVEEDAQFLLDLRLCPKKNKYISKTSAQLEDQLNWLRSYELSDDQAYFAICDYSGKKLGCIRMYDPKGSSYCWGSWLMVNGLGPLVAIESVILLYAYGRHLGFNESRIYVQNGNKHTWRFHEKFSTAELVKTDAIYRHYIINEYKINSLLDKYSFLLTSPLRVLKK
jgi:hypothetical protein